MLASVLERNREFQPDAGFTFDEYLRLGTGRPALTPCTRLEAWRAVGGPTGEVDFIRHAASEGRVRPMLVVPVSVERDFASECSLPK